MALLSYTTDKTCVKGKGLDDCTHSMICGLVVKVKWKQVEISKKLEAPTLAAKNVVMKVP
jgi:hypothetical protein